MRTGRRSRDGESWQEDHYGGRDLTRWPSAAGRGTVRATGWALDRVRRALPGRLSDQDLPWLVLAVIVGVGGALAVVTTMLSTLLYESVVERDGMAALDKPVLDWMVERRSPALDTWVTHYTDLGGTTYLTPIVILAAALLCWWWRRWTPAVLLAIGATGSLLMTIAGKDLIGRVRPPHSLAVPPYETSPSFPSGHTLNSIVLLVLIGYLIAVRTSNRALTIAAPAVAVVLAVAMGLSRVYLGHHWMTDVLVGWTLGIAWLAIIITGHRLALTVRRWTGGGPDEEPADPAAEQREAS
ncbi:MAG: phosphatase PAP2 family protein [Nocardioides sp.]